MTASLISRSSIRRVSVRPVRCRRARRRQLFEGVLGIDALDRRHLCPGTVGLEAPGQYIVLELDLEDLRELILQGAVQNRDHGLDPAIEVTRHQVRRTQVVLGRSTVRTKSKDPRMLEE